MISFVFSRRDPEAPGHGFDIGDLEIATPNETATTKQHKPDQGTMIYLMMISLLDCTYEFLNSPKKKQIEIIAPDSSFSLLLQRSKQKNQIIISSGKKLLGTFSDKIFVSSLISAVDSFLEGTNLLQNEDPVLTDLTNSLSRLRTTNHQLMNSDH